MIRITNGTTNKVVTKGAYDNFYKPLGYTVVSDSNKKREVEIIEEPKKEVKEEIKVIEEDNKDKGEKKSQKVEKFRKR